MNNDLVFQKIKSTVDGIGATTGKQTEKAFNENFDLVKRLFTEVLTALSITVTSAQMKQIKVDTSTTPYTLYYTLDDESVANPTWYKLLQFGFSQLTGSPMDNIALKTVLDSKASQGLVDNLVLQVKGCVDTATALQKSFQDLKDNEITDLQNEDIKINNDITNLKAKDSTLEAAIKVNKDAIDNINTDLSRVVFTEVGSTLWMRYNSGDKKLELSINQGTTWSPIGTLNMSWDQIVGQPNASTSLVNYVSSTISAALTNYTTKKEFNDHTTNYDNPHKVTANQLGLGSVNARLQALESQSSNINYANPTSYLKHYGSAAEGLWVLSSSFGRVKLKIEEDSYYGLVYTLKSLTDSYTGSDGTVITINKWETDPNSIPIYYKCDYNVNNTDYVDIKYNPDLYTYIQGGGVLD